MPVRSVIKIGNPLLKRRAEAVTDITSVYIQNVIQDMFDTMQAENGAGIAAPQIGESLRIVIFGFEKNPRYPQAEPVPMTVLINPLIEAISDAMEEGWEGCLSVPGFRGKVSRYTDIRYQGFNEKGERIDRTVNGFHARVVQHEVDHLDGILYPQRIEDLTQFGLIEELEKSGQIPKLPLE